MSRPVMLAEAGPVPRHHRVLVSALDFDKTVAALKAAIVAADLWLIAEIDPSMLLARDGRTMPPARQLLFFHPRYMARLLAANPSGLPEAPLKFVVLTHADGNIRIHHPDPAAAFAGHAGLAPLGLELAALTSGMLAAMPVAEAALPHRRAPWQPT